MNILIHIALLSTYFPPNYVQKVATKPEGRVFIKKLLDVI